MSGYVGEAATIRGWFDSEWDATVPIHMVDGSAFKDKPDNGPWARMAIQSRGAEVASIGGPAVSFRHTGDVVVEIFVPEGVGDGRGRALADLACDILRGKQDGGIVVWNARAIPLGVHDGWYRINVIGPYQRDEDFEIQPS